MKKKILIIILVVLVLITGIMLIISKRNLGNEKVEIDENGQKIVHQNQTVYISINPLLKIDYEETFKMCAEPASSKICSDITTKIINVELLNNDAKKIYNNVNLLSKDIYDGINKVIEETKDNNIDTSTIDIICNSGNFLIEKLGLGEEIKVNYTFQSSINEQNILNEDAKKFTILFDTDGGNTILSQTVRLNDHVIRPDDPSKNGYTFIEWQLDDEPYQFGNPVTSDLTLKALWKANEYNGENKTYTVTFNTDGGSNVGPQVIKSGSYATRPTDPVKNGYKFAGWKLNDVLFNFTTKITSNLTLKAVWVENKTEFITYTVQFDTDGGSNIAAQFVKEGNKIKVPKSPIKANYTFVEWTLNGESFNTDTIITNNITLVAKWQLTNVPQPNKYIVTFNSDGGSKVESQTVTEGFTATKPDDPVRKGFTFICWTLNGIEYDFSVPITSNISLVANWE